MVKKKSVSCFIYYQSVILLEHISKMADLGHLSFLALCIGVLLFTWKDLSFSQESAPTKTVRAPKLSQIAAPTLKFLFWWVYEAVLHFPLELLTKVLTYHEFTTVRVSIEDIYLMLFPFVILISLFFSMIPNAGGFRKGVNKGCSLVKLYHRTQSLSVYLYLPILGIRYIILQTEIRVSCRKQRK